MNSLIKHFNNCQKIQQLFKKAETDELAENLYWYDLTIKYASSKFGFLQIFFFWRICNQFAGMFSVFKKKKNSAYSENYQKENPKNYGAESIYHKAIKKFAKYFKS